MNITPTGFQITEKYSGQDALTSEIFYGRYNGQPAVMKVVPTSNSLNSLKECWILSRLKTKPEVYSFGVMNGFFYIILEEFSGDTPDISDERLQNEVVIYQIAQDLAKLHHTPTSNLFLCGNTKHHVANGVDFWGSVEEFFDTHTQRMLLNLPEGVLTENDMSLIYSTVDSVRVRFLQDQSELHFCLVHRDAKWSNLIIDGDLNTNLIDYGAAMWGFRELEFGLIHALSFVLKFETFVEKLIDSYCVIVFKGNLIEENAFRQRLALLKRYYLIWVMCSRIKRNLSSPEEIKSIICELQREE